jgi:hypothetical protein
MSDAALTARLAAALNDDGRISCDELDVNNPDPACPDCGDVFRLARALLPVVREYGDQRAAEAKAKVWSLAASWVGPPFAAEFRDRAAALRGEAGRGT